MAKGGNRLCPACRRDAVVELVAAADPSLPRAAVVAAVDAVAGSAAALRSLAAALSADRAALSCGAPPTVGRLVSELITRGSTTLVMPACVACARTGHPLTRTEAGAMCRRCAHRAGATACARCGLVKPVAGRGDDNQPICERCRRHERGQRRCGMCGKTAAVAVRARAGEADVCVNCYRLPEAVCARCGRRRPCTFAASGTPICKLCASRSTDRCARCGRHRPPTVRWPEGPLCDPCYTAALRHRGRCDQCGVLRRLVTPPGPSATTCADCAGLPTSHVCADCGIEDKLYERGRCAPCSLRRRTSQLLRAGAEQIPNHLTGVFDAIVASRSPRSALNWLRNGAGAAVLTDLATGRLALTHEALDGHPSPRGADYLRHMLVANAALPPRNEELARTEQWVINLIEQIEQTTERRLVKAYATWRVMRRLRRSAERNPRPRTYTRHARVRIRAAADFLTWLAQRGLTLAACRQGDVDIWLCTAPAARNVRDFLTWAAERKHCPPLDVAGPKRATGTATEPDQRWAIVARLLHDDTLQPTDRVAGLLLLLYGQQLSRIAAMTIDQVIERDGTIVIRFGQDDVAIPEPLAAAVTELIRAGRTYVGVGSPTTTRWLFPGLLPGRPITASRLGDRLGHLGIDARAARRSSLIHLAAHLPAAVLADLLHIAPTTAVRWMHDAGTDSDLRKLVSRTRDNVRFFLHQSLEKSV
ncbi:MAG TPA: hypothetical protein VFI47_01620 [Acidimicrobiales bacterium]|nr:hypothetical protein [Acidimicrobiales bacterium]